MEILFVGTVRPRAQFAVSGLFAFSGLFAADPLPVAPAPDGPTIANSNATVAATESRPPRASGRTGSVKPTPSTQRLRTRSGRQESACTARRCSLQGDCESGG